MSFCFGSLSIAQIIVKHDLDIGKHYHTTIGYLVFEFIKQIWKDYVILINKQ